MIGLWLLLALAGFLGLFAVLVLLFTLANAFGGRGVSGANAFIRCIIIAAFATLSIWLFSWVIPALF